MTRVAGKNPANGAAETAAAAEKAARKLQARSSGAQSGDVITWKGEVFRLEPGDLPGAATMIMTHMGAMDPSVRDPDAEDGMYQILEMCLAQPSGAPPGDPEFDVETYDPGEFKRFMRHAARTRAPLEEIVEALTAIVEVFAARPTGRRPGSSDGRPAITASSTGTSSEGPAAESGG